jgi:hypothetical protein
VFKFLLGIADNTYGRRLKIMKEKKWIVRVWIMTASYEIVVWASDQMGAISAARQVVDPDQKNWNYTPRLA